jgi:NAD-dependent deacetylase
VQVGKQSGAKTVELNLDPTGNSTRFDQSVNGLASVIVPAFVESLLA